MTGRMLAWLLVGVSVACFVGGHLLMLAAGQAVRPSRFLPDVFLALAFLGYAVVGGVVVARQSANRVGWILVAMGLVYQVRAVAVGYVAYVIERDPDAWLPPEAVAWLAGLWILPFTLLGLLAIVFPTGRLPSSRWGPVVWCAAAVTLIGFTVSTLEVDGRVFIFPGIDRLLATDAGRELVDVMGGIAQFGLLALGLGTLPAILLRLRRASGAEREQLKWFASGVALVFAVLTAETIVFLVRLNEQLDPGAEYPASLWLGLPAAVAVFTLPMAIGTAILRYRLYDIDLVIRRTLVYGGLTATLAAVYVGSVIALQGVLSGFTGGSSLAVAASTLAVAALFQPLRRRIQTAVDRRFYRSRYDAASTVQTFAAQLRHEVDLEHLTDELRGVVAETLRPASVSVWLRRGGME